jgi:erythromycin esterase-like protein
MYRGNVSSWNLRDRHMAATLDALLTHLGRHHAHPRVVVWAHNSHVGDARATEMGARGELTIGQLARQRYGDAALLVGFTTYDGSVTAARDWGDEPEQRWVRAALPGSHEAFLHETLALGAGLERAWLDTSDPVVRRHLAVARLYRAIGVVYRPETERWSHYFSARLADTFDAVIHLDRTAALEPLVRGAVWDDAEPPETYPSGL